MKRLLFGAALFAFVSWLGIAGHVYAGSAVSHRRWWRQSQRPPISSVRRDARPAMRISPKNSAPIPTGNLPSPTEASLFGSQATTGNGVAVVFGLVLDGIKIPVFARLERRSDCRPINFRIRGVRWGGGYLCPDVNLKTQILYQPQRCCLAQKRKKKPEQLRYQDDSDFAGLIPVRPGFNLAKTAQATIRHDLHGIESRRFRPCQGQSTRSKSLKAINPHGCTELSAQRLIDAHSCGFGFESGRAGIGFASNKPASQIARFLWRNHWIRSFFKSYGIPARFIAAK